MPPSRSTQNCLTVLHGPVVILTGAQIAVAHRLVLAGSRYLQGAGMPLRSAERAIISELQSATSDMRAQHQRQHRHLDPTTGQDSPLTADALALQRGLSVRTIQRQAKLYGGWKHKGRWQFPADLRY